MLSVTIVLTTHYLEEAELMCDRIAIMNHGKIAALQETSDLLYSLGERRLSLVIPSLPEKLPTSFDKYKPEIERSEHRVSFPINNGKEIASIIQLTYEHQLDVQEVETIRPDLEKIFLSVTRNHNAGR